MRLSTLLTEAGIEVRIRTGDAEVSAVAIDSRRCGPGSCFVAVVGGSRDGHDFIASARQAGAAAAIVQDASRVPEGMARAQVDDTRAAAGRLAQALLGWPARALRCAGVTGTNGKTTVACLLRHILARAGHKTGLLGTIGYETGVGGYEASATTPDPIRLAALCAEMQAAGYTHMVMEASSHALDQDRVSGLSFETAIFTNLTGDHLDYHRDMDGYARAKQRLFASLGPEATAVINRDDPAGEKMAVATRARIVWYGLNAACDVWARIERLEASVTEFSLVTPAGLARVSLPLIGRHNVYNALAAAAAAERMGVAPDRIAAALSEAPPVPGRLQRVPSEAPFEVFVDYAHTDDALENVLSVLRPLTRGRLTVVFGCGGDRDRSKRPRMARVAARWADRLVVTSDNPRTEEPEAIIAEIVDGLDANGRKAAHVEADRRAAIGWAVEQARAGDVVLIAGKGHERVQIVGSQRLPFDDMLVAGEWLGTAAGGR